MSPLDQYLTDCGQLKFAWGQHDCVLFVASWLKIHSSKDVLVGYPKWKSERGALRILNNKGGLEACVTDALGEPTNLAPKDGDIALLPDKLGGLCIVYGAYAVGPAKPLGLGFHPFTNACKIWKV